MLKKFMTVAAVLSFLFSSNASAAKYFGARPEGTPSVINYGWDGLKLGLFTGLSIGYLDYSNSNNSSAITNGAAYGALLGVGAGLLIGISDASKGRKGMGAIYLRDMQKGGTLGLLVGALIGALQGSGKALGEGAAWGYLGGEVAGFFIASFEGPVILREYSGADRLSVNLAAVRGSDGNYIPGLRIQGKF